MDSAAGRGDGEPTREPTADGFWCGFDEWATKLMCLAQHDSRSEPSRAASRHRRRGVVRTHDQLGAVGPGLKAHQAGELAKFRARSRLAVSEHQTARASVHPRSWHRPRTPAAVAVANPPGRPVRAAQSQPAAPNGHERPHHPVTSHYAWSDLGTALTHESPPFPRNTIGVSQRQSSPVGGLSANLTRSQPWARSSR